MSEQKLKIAVFIDFDNVEIGVKTTLGLPFDIGAVLEAVKERGEIITKVAYGDWKRAGDYGRAMAQHAVRLVQRVMTPGGDKNGADINLALDALEMAFTYSHINAFVIVGGDSDFITLVEKLKQYDRKVFVVGGRAFTSQVMQKNCTEFIAYENIVPDRRPSQARPERGGGGAERPRHAATQPIDGAVALVKRALKVLADREVTPQLGLLKSTLLQLDSSFSERDYGVSSFRDFADKLAQQGLVSLKHQGRSTLVELADGVSEDSDAPTAPVIVAPPPVIERMAPPPPPPPPPPAPPSKHDDDDADGFDGDSSDAEPGNSMPANTGGVRSADSASLGDGVALVRRVLGEATTTPRWPMYPRQFKQFLRAADPAFDERKYGSIAELMRACQKDGILKLERDRQGGLRVFAAGSARPSVPHGWSLIAGGGATPDEAAADPLSDAMDAPVLTDEAMPDLVPDVASLIEVADEPLFEPPVAELPFEPATEPVEKRARKSAAKKTAVKKPVAKKTAAKKAAPARKKI